MQNQKIQPRILRTPDAAAFCGLASSTFEKLRISGNGPRFVRLGSRAVGYVISDLEEWLAHQSRSSTSDDGARAT